MTTFSAGFVAGSEDIRNLDNVAAVLNSLYPLASAGTVEASKVVLVDTNKDITGFRNLTITGSLSAAAKTDYRKFLGIKDILLLSAGTWTITRVAQGDYVYRKTAGDDTTIIGIDITEEMRSTASKGLSLTSFDVIFRNTTGDLDAHTVTLDRILYTDSDTVTVTSITTSGSLGVGQDADPQIDTITVTTPAYATAGHKYVIELTVNAGAGSVYDFIGINLNFSKNVT